MSKPAREAAAVLVTTGPREDLQVLLVRRSPEMRFFGGYWAFPGGAMEDIDRATLGLATLSCAVRELMEETTLVADQLADDAEAASALLAELAAGEKPPSSWLDALRRVHASGRYRYVCRITTPGHQPIRFATDFVELHIEAPGELRLDARELVEGRFMPAREAVAAWRRGEMPIAPPTLLLLELLAEHGSPAYVEPAAKIAESFEQGEFHPARFSPGVFTAPVPTPTLPPATTTNCYIVGTHDLYVIDPAAVDDKHQRKLIRKIEAMCADGAQLRAVLLTHHHPDHVGAVGVISRHFGVPVHAHALTYAQLPDRDFIRGQALADGDRLPLGTAPDGTPDWQLEVLHTPGHARDHLCFIDSRYRAAIVGDMLSTISTIIIDPPEGHMATYLRSLERLLEVDMTVLHPAHGPSWRDGPALVRQYLAHRRAREEKVLAALGADPQPAEALLPKAYGEVPEAIHGAALRSLIAGLEKLAEEGRAAQRANGWVLVC